MWPASKLVEMHLTEGRVKKIVEFSTKRLTPHPHGRVGVEIEDNAIQLPTELELGLSLANGKSI